MLRKNLASALVFVLAMGLITMAGCKKKKADSKSTAGDTKSDMTAPAMEADAMGRAAARPADAMDAARPAAVAGRAGALPLPADFLFIRINLKAARGTEVYKAYEPKIREMMTKAMAKDDKGVAKALIETCKLDPTTTIDEVVIGMSLEGIQKADAIALLSGSFDTAKVMACVKPEMAKMKVTPKDVTVAGKPGMTFKGTDGKENTVVALSANSFAIASGANQAKMAAVLEGKTGSIEDSPLYKEYAAKANADTVLMVLVPSLPASLAAAAPMPILKDIKAVSTLIGLPAGGLDVQVALNLGDKDKAEKLAKSLPLLVGLAKAKLPVVGETIAQNLKVKADAGWVKVGLALDKATFGKLVKIVQGMLGGAMKQDDDAAKPAKAPKAAPAAMKAAK